MKGRLHLSPGRDFGVQNGEPARCPLSRNSLYFESSIPHAYRAVERKNARTLTVIYPPR
jgi:hypothetical protein